MHACGILPTPPATEADRSCGEARNGKWKNSRQDFEVTRGYAYFVFTLLFLLYLFDYVDRVVVASLFPYLKTDWGLTDTECGWPASIVTLMMTLFVFPVSLLVDR